VRGAPPVFDIAFEPAFDSVSMLHVDPAAIPSASAHPPAPGDARALIEGQQAMLARLAQVGMQIAEECGRQAATAPIAAGLAFARVARAVRMTIALQSRLAKDLAALDRADDVAQAARTTRRRIRLSRLVEDAARAGIAARIDAGARYGDEDAVEDEIERLSYEAYERLTDAEDDDLAGRPFDAVVAGICRDLGLPLDWTARIQAVTQPPLPLGEVAREAGRRGGTVQLAEHFPLSDGLRPPPPPKGRTSPAAPPRAPP